MRVRVAPFAMPQPNERVSFITIVTLMLTLLRSISSYTLNRLKRTACQPMLLGSCVLLGSLFYSGSQASAQTISKANLFSVGDVYAYTVFDSTKAIAGPAGANATWNFSGVGPSLGTDVDQIVAASSTTYGSKFPTATYASQWSDQRVEYAQVNGPNVYLLGFTQTSSVVSTNERALAVLRNPLVYGQIVRDTVNQTTQVSGALNATGTTRSYTVVDGTGALITPMATYTNVMRVRYEINMQASLIFGSETIHIVRYDWYDANHKQPLAEIDSTQLSGSILQENLVNGMYYIESSSGVAQAKADRQQLLARSEGNNIVLDGVFEAGEQYHVDVVNVLGERMQSLDATSTNGRELVLPSSPLATGTYMIRLSKGTGVQGIAKLWKH